MECYGDTGFAFCDPTLVAFARYAVGDSFVMDFYHPNVGTRLLIEVVEVEGVRRAGAFLREEPIRDVGLREDVSGLLAGSGTVTLGDDGLHGVVTLMLESRTNPIDMQF